MSLSNMTEGGEITNVTGPLPLEFARPRPDWRAWLRTAAVLFKLRIVGLLLLAAVGGAFLGAGGWPGLGALALLLVTGGLAASGASALNQYLERASDGLMGRTRQRPLAAGAIAQPRRILWLGATFILLPSLAALPFNPALAFFLLLGAFIYVGVYTLWLKPRSLLNIVIGGAAGSAAVMSGGAAVGAWRDPAVIVLALLIFLWTPSHFWTLAILYRAEYQRANIPMLPAQVEPRLAAVWVLLHTAATVLAAVTLAAVPVLGWLYFVPICLASVEYFRRNLELMARPTPANARALFVTSNLYLMVVLLAICLDTAL